MEELTGGILARCGYSRYEISNYARPGFLCRHNINYWQNGSWLGLGAGAVSSLSGTRATNVADPADFIERTSRHQNPFSEFECLSRQASFRETVIMGLRMMAGISIQDMQNRFRINPLVYYGGTLRTLLDQGWVILENGSLRLSESTLPFANQVLRQLV
jgi:oxygen-independent coproporphyrinogen-3 oxidase